MLPVLNDDRLRALLFDPFAPVRREVCVPSQTGKKTTNAGPTSAPLTLWEDETKVYVEVDVPGLTRDALELTVDDGKLWIRGERKQSTRENAAVRHEERRYGQFERSIALGEMVDFNAIEAELADGVLTVTLAKKAEAQPQKIQIRSVAEQPTES